MWGEGRGGQRRTQLQTDVIEVSEGVTTGVSANPDLRRSVPRAAAHCSAAHWTYVASCWMSASAQEKLAGCDRFPVKNKRIPMSSKPTEDVVGSSKGASAAQKFWAVVVIWETNSLEEKIHEKRVSSFHKLEEKRNPNLLCPMTSCATELKLSQNVFQSLAFQREVVAPKNSRGGDN